MRRDFGSITIACSYHHDVELQPATRFLIAAANIRVTPDVASGCCVLDGSVCVVERKYRFSQTLSECDQVQSQCSHRSNECRFFFYL